MWADGPNTPRPCVEATPRGHRKPVGRLFHVPVEQLGDRERPGHGHRQRQRKRDGAQQCDAGKKDRKVHQVEAERNTPQPLGDGRVTESLGRPAEQEQHNDQRRAHRHNGLHAGNRLLAVDPFRVGQENAQGGNEQPGGAWPGPGQLTDPIPFDADNGPDGENRKIGQPFLVQQCSNQAQQKRQADFHLPDASPAQCDEDVHREQEGKRDFPFERPQRRVDGARVQQEQGIFEDLPHTRVNDVHVGPRTLQWRC